ncbi:MAG: hypothetical protein ABI175_28600, partial [Polyangiales bacterium]
MRYARIGGDNVFAEISTEEQSYETALGRWHIRGGHRLWYAPEGDPRSYHPDDATVRTEVEGARVAVVQAVESHTHLEKAISVELAPEGSRVRVQHRLTNRGAETVRLAPWALTVMARGGRAILSQPPYAPHPQVIAPARPLVTWPFTRMADPRWTWGDRLVQLRHDPSARDAQKVGAYDAQGFLAYAVGRQMFVKRHTPRPGPHADFGCNVQMFTNALILELETLGPLVELPPGGSVAHDEEWWLFDGVVPPEDEVALAAYIATKTSDSAGVV